MYDVSVITATQARPSRMGWFHELWQSMGHNTCNWEWVVAVDEDDTSSHDSGNAKFIPKDILHDPRVTVVNLGQRFGTAVARNVALGLAQGETVTSVDDDDVLPPGSLDVRLRKLSSTSEYGWVAGMLGNLWLNCSHCGDVGCWSVVDGASNPGTGCVNATWVREQWKAPAQPGFYRAGQIVDLVSDWLAVEPVGKSLPSMRYADGLSKPPPLGPTTLLMHKELIHAVGGWYGLPQGEDLGMLFAATSLANGYVLPDEVYLYRKHAGQTVAGEGFDRWEGFIRRMTAMRGKTISEHFHSKPFPSTVHGDNEGCAK